MRSFFSLDTGFVIVNTWSNNKSGIMVKKISAHVLEYLVFWGDFWALAL